MEIYEYIIIIFAIILLYLIVNTIIIKIKDKIVIDEIELFCQSKNYSFTKSTKKSYDFEIENDEFKMLCCICKIPSNSSVTINSRTTYCLRFGGGTRHGRNYPHKRYLNELNQFLQIRDNNKTIDKNGKEKQLIKVIIFYPKTEIILKYLNESEITEINPSIDNYGFRSISYDIFFNHFDELIKTKKIK